MSELLYESDGFDSLEKLLTEYEGATENVMEALETGAAALVSDIRSLPKPRSEITKPGYTHLLDTVTYKKGNEEVEAGWGKYYGPMLEKGTKKMKGVEHIRPTYDRNADKYVEKMKKVLFE